MLIHLLRPTTTSRPWPLKYGPDFVTDNFIRSKKRPFDLQNLVVYCAFSINTKSERGFRLIDLIFIDSFGGAQGERKSAIIGIGIWNSGSLPTYFSSLLQVGYIEIFYLEAWIEDGPR